MKRAIKILMIFLTVILSGLTIIFIITFIKRLTLPYNSEGRYFDESSMVVYHDDGIIAYGLLAFAFTVLTLFIGYVAKKLSIK